MATSKYGFVIKGTRSTPTVLRAIDEDSKSAEEKKREADLDIVERIVRRAAREVDLLAAEIDPIVRDIMADFVIANSRNTPLIEKLEFCPHFEIDEKRPWQQYEKIHRWHVEYDDAHIYAELRSMTTSVPLPLIGAHSGLHLTCVIKFAHTVSKTNLHKLDDVFEDRIGIPAIIEVIYEAEDSSQLQRSHKRSSL